jgi:hypothetical protein
MPCRGIRIKNYSLTFDQHPDSVIALMNMPATPRK